MKVYPPLKPPNTARELARNFRAQTFSNSVAHIAKSALSLKVAALWAAEALSSSRKVT